MEKINATFLVTTLIYALQHLSLDYHRYEYVILINLCLVAAALAVPFSHRISDTAGGLLLVGNSLAERAADHVRHHREPLDG